MPTNTTLHVPSTRRLTPPRSRRAKQVSTTPAPTPTLPIILILGPPGSGKGTICKQLTSDFHLHHLSVGDWLRAQTQPPIAGVPEHINRYVFNDEVVPEEVMEAEYGKGKGKDAPAPLTLYQCTKRNVSTPESMKRNLMPALRAEIHSLSATEAGSKEWWRWHPQPQPQSQPKAILLDNLTSTLSHSTSAAATFGPEFPTLVISVDCSDSTAEARFLARGRGSDDAARFRRRIVRYRKGSEEVMAFLRERATKIVEVSTEGEPGEVYGELLDAFAKNGVWNAVVAADEEPEDIDIDVGVDDLHKRFAGHRSEVSVRS